MLFQEKLLPVCVCTETLAAGINLPARSVVLSTLVKGPREKKRLIDPGTAQQMFGRAGRPQFDTEGHVFALAHEDDVRLAHWKLRYDSIPEDTKDPKLMAAKKALLKKKPSRRTGFTYWNAEQFAKLQTAPAARLASKGRLTWRWLGYLLDADPSVEPIRQVIRRRLMEPAEVEGELKRLTKMLVTLDHMGVVGLEPRPPKSWQEAVKPGGVPTEVEEEEESEQAPSEGKGAGGLIGRLTLGGGVAGPKAVGSSAPRAPAAPEPYEPAQATPTGKLRELMVFRAVHPLYGLFLMDYLGKADDGEMVQILESLLEMPGSVAKALRVPWPDELPPGKLATEVIDPAILTSGLATQEDLYPQADQSDVPPELRKYPVPLAQKMRMVFESQIDHAGGLFVTPVWAVGDLLAHGGGFDQFVRARDIVKQEGIVFKHLLRMILLCNEFAQLTPKDASAEEWQMRLRGVAERLTGVCHAVDPQSTDEMLEQLADEAQSA
jgi:hypothetical protein